MKKFALLLALLFLSPSISYAQLGESTGLFEFKKFEDNPIQSALVIVDTEGGTGSGFIVGKDLILTADHCVGGCKRISIKIPRLGFVSGPVKVVRRDASKDLSLLKVDLPKGLRILSISKTPPEMGDDVEFLGFAGFSKPRHFDSEILSVSGDQYLLNGVVIQGDSGGAILNSDGDVVGMIQRGQTPLKKFYLDYDGNTIAPMMLALTSGHTSEALNKFLAEPNDKPSAN